LLLHLIAILVSENNKNFCVSVTCRSCFYHIRDLRPIRHYISLLVDKTIARALITGRLDYCNSLLYNIASKDILKLQRVQNCLVRVVTRSARCFHSVSLLKSPHWLPVQPRIIFKLWTIAYQILSSGEPSYLFSMLSLAPKPRELRSSGFHLLSVRRVKSHTGTRAFSVAVPTRWNSLAEHVTGDGKRNLTFRSKYNAKKLLFYSLSDALIK